MSDELKAPEKQEKKEVKKVITGDVVTKKKSELSKLSDIFTTNDANNVKEYLWKDVVKPTLSDALSDIVGKTLKGFTDAIKDIVDTKLYGAPKKRQTTYSSGSYRAYFNDGRSNSSSTSLTVATGYHPDDIILENRGDAEDVLSQMSELVERYGVVSVADLYDLIGKSGRYTDNKYGWTNLRNAEVSRVREGYLLKLPRAMPID